MQAFKEFLGKGQYFVIGVLGAAIALAFNPGAQATNDAGAPGQALSPITLLFLVIGIVVSVLYLKAMLTILNEAADSYEEIEEESTGSYYAAPAWGALLAGILAALVIAGYGIGPSMLYLGPILAMVSPIAILYCMAQDIKSFKVSRAKQQQTSPKELARLRH